MARVNVEESAMVAAKMAAREAKMDRQKVMGALVQLWRDSQAFEATEASLAELAAWTEIENPSVLERLVAALERYGILKKSREGVWEIVGNEKHIANLRQRKESASAGGKASTRTRLKKSQADAQPSAQANAQASGQVSSLQCSTLQDSTEHKEQSVGLGRCEKVWLETLKFFGSDRERILQDEKVLIARSIQANGADNVELALFGARYEPKTDRFNPKDHVSIARVLTKDNEGRPRIQKFVDYGLKARRRVTEKPKPESVIETVDPAKVREILAQAGFAKRDGAA